MPLCVLVHGAMHGGWCWDRVRPLLEARNWTVLTPTLAGQGERRSELRPEIGASLHAREIAGLLRREGARDAHLVLHSYAGILAGPIAEQADGKLGRITFLGAFLTAPGQALFDVQPPATAARYRALAQEHGEGWRLPADPSFLDQWGLSDPALRSWAGERLTDFPLRCLSERLSFDPRFLDALPKHYIRHTRPPLPSLAPFWDIAAGPGWTRGEIACGHELMLEAPAETAECLMAFQSFTPHSC